MVVVHVDHAGLRVCGLGDLVDVALGGQAGADVQELVDAAVAGQLVHGRSEERAVVSRCPGCFRNRGS